MQEDAREWALDDCQSTRKTLLELIAGRLRSARVVKLENVNRATAAGFVLLSVEAYIGQLADILTLPEKKAR